MCGHTLIKDIYNPINPIYPSRKEQSENERQIQTLPICKIILSMSVVFYLGVKKRVFSFRGEKTRKDTILLYLFA